MIKAKEGRNKKKKEKLTAINKLSTLFKSGSKLEKVLASYEYALLIFLALFPIFVQEKTFKKNFKKEKYGYTKRNNQVRF